jgi:hypothetical protein
MVRVEMSHSQPSLTTSRRNLGPLGVSVLALVSLSGAPALAAGSGSSTATINVGTPPVLSLTVSPSTITYTNCAGGSSTPSTLGFPNGTCAVGDSPTLAGSPGGVTITNTGEPSQIDVNGGNATPSDLVTPWSLTTSLPGANQFSEETSGSVGIGHGTLLDDAPLVSDSHLTSTPACDEAFDVPGGNCTTAIASGVATTEQLIMKGPSSSTDTSSTLATVITWTAVPPI